MLVSTVRTITGNLGFLTLRVVFDPSRSGCVTSRLDSHPSAIGTMILSIESVTNAVESRLRQGQTDQELTDSVDFDTCFRHGLNWICHGLNCICDGLNWICHGLNCVCDGLNCICHGLNCVCDGLNC